ncbi:MAG TPA: ABC transporter substrate-binding protein [Acetobacteraceae bacterium]|nr:ABC transporter substrate-binding protein [Acetobacteraceae bacterium]
MSSSASRHGHTIPYGPAVPLTRRSLFALTALGATTATGRAIAAPQSQLTYGMHVSLAASWFDPGEAAGIITPYMLLYGIHDALVKAMPANQQAPSLAESFTASEDGLTYDFVLRGNAKFHNGDPVTSDDVKFSFERYRGASQSLLRQRVAAVEIPDAQHVRFKLKEPWPDFMTFYAGVTGAAWIVPRKYLTQVGDDGFKKAPIGAGPYRYVSFTPGVELVLEAFDGYWRKPPPVKRIVMKVIPEEATRLAALKRGEIDIAYSIRGELAGELLQSPGLSLKPVVVQGVFCIYFVDQWDPKSPWHDVRVRRAANLAIDRDTINEALTRGYSRVTGNPFIPDMYEFYWQPPKPTYDPAQAKKLLAEAGYPNGFDAGAYNCDSSYSNVGEAVVNNLGEVGIRAKLRPLERAAYIKAFAEKSYKNIIQAGPAGFGNAATRLETHAVTGGTFTYGTYPELDELFQLQSREPDHKRREALLHKMQQIIHEKAIYAPIWQLAFINGVGPRVAESAFGLIPGFPYTAPFEDLVLKPA